MAENGGVEKFKKYYIKLFEFVQYNNICYLANITQSILEFIESN